eukprot:5374569-Pyramimonas_sp.AAC.1
MFPSMRRLAPISSFQTPICRQPFSCPNRALPQPTPSCPPLSRDSEASPDISPQTPSAAKPFYSPTASYPNPVPPAHPHTPQRYRNADISGRSE